MPLGLVLDKFRGVVLNMGYEKPLSIFLLARGIAVCIVNAKRVRDYAKAIGRHAKNDRIDAQVIRLYAEMAQPKQLE